MQAGFVSSRMLGVAVLLLVSTSALALTVDFNSNDGGFTASTSPAAMEGPWTYGATAGAGGTGGWYANGQGPENQTPNTTTLLSPTVVLSATGHVILSFDHIYSFEGGNWDGGQVQLSVNGGAFSAVLGAAFSANGYNGTVLPNSASVLNGQEAFVLNSPGYPQFITSVADLGSFGIGDSIRVAFLFGSDTNTRGAYSPNWAIDSFSLDVRSDSVPVPATLALLGIGLAGFGLARRGKAQ